MKLIPRFDGPPCTDEIYDKKTDKYYRIAYIENVLPNGEAVFGEVLFESVNVGLITLFGDNPEHQRKYRYLTLSNYNQSNANKLESVEPVFKRLNKSADVKHGRDLRKQITTVIRQICNLAKRLFL